MRVIDVVTDEVKTIKDLLDWAIEHNALDLELSLECHTVRDGEVVRVYLVTNNGNKFVSLS